VYDIMLFALHNTASQLHNTQLFSMIWGCPTRGWNGTTCPVCLFRLTSMSVGL